MLNAQFILSPSARHYLAETLTSDQQLWLTDNLIRRPLGLATFFLADEGREVMRLVVDEYKSFTTKFEAPVLPK